MSNRGTTAARRWPTRGAVIAVAAAALAARCSIALAADVLKHEGTAIDPFDLATQVDAVKHAAASLPLACALGAALAFRPRRRGTPPRTASVIQTQVILALGSVPSSCSSSARAWRALLASSAWRAWCATAPRSTIRRMRA
jgi:hypothetical protein